LQTNHPRNAEPAAPDVFRENAEHCAEGCCAESIQVAQRGSGTQSTSNLRQRPVRAIRARAIASDWKLQIAAADRTIPAVYRPYKKREKPIAC